jgi:hypothetical protein
MENEKSKEARRNEVGYCGDYCRTCHWYNDALRKPAAQLLDLVKSHFEVGVWINYKGGNSDETIKGLEILSKGACNFNCKGGGGWNGCPVRKCCTTKGVDFCFECPEFPCERNWGKKSQYANAFTADKIKRLKEMQKTGVEEWIDRKWKQ